MSPWRLNICMRILIPLLLCISRSIVLQLFKCLHKARQHYPPPIPLPSSLPGFASAPRTGLFTDTARTLLQNVSGAACKLFDGGLVLRSLRKTAGNYYSDLFSNLPPPPHFISLIKGTQKDMLGVMDSQSHLSSGGTLIRRFYIKRRGTPRLVCPAIEGERWRENEWGRKRKGQ